MATSVTKLIQEVKNFSTSAKQILNNTL